MKTIYEKPVIAMEMIDEQNVLCVSGNASFEDFNENDFNWEG